MKIRQVVGKYNPFLNEAHAGSWSFDSRLSLGSDLRGPLMSSKQKNDMVLSTHEIKQSSVRRLLTYNPGSHKDS